MNKHALTIDATVHTADVAAFATVADTTHVLLVRRAFPPYAGYWALPGGHVDPGETTRHAAARELAEETGLDLTPPALTLVGVYDAPGRDPRGTYSSTAYTVRLHPTWLPPRAEPGDDADHAQWIPLNQVARLAFDHDRILRDTLRGEVPHIPTVTSM